MRAGVRQHRGEFPAGPEMPAQPDASDIAIGRRVRRKRLEAGLTQAALGTSLGVSIQQLQKYETGQNRISAARLIDIGAALGVSASALLGEGAPDASDEALLETQGALELLRAYAAIPSDAHRRGLLAMARSLGPDGATA